jgi:hypothetical protein
MDDASARRCSGDTYSPNGSSEFMASSCENDEGKNRTEGEAWLTEVSGTPAPRLMLHIAPRSGRQQAHGHLELQRFETQRALAAALRPLHDALQVVVVPASETQARWDVSGRLRHIA